MAASVVAYRRGRAGRWFDALLMLPLGTSAVTIGFGFLVSLDAPLDLRASWALVPLAHALVAVPFVVRSVVPVMRSVRARLREAAAVLGAAPGRVWREIDLPMVARAAAAGAGFAFAVSLGSSGPLPSSPALAPHHAAGHLSLPGAAGRAQLRPGHGHERGAHGVTAAAVALIDRYRPATLGEF